jgi:hypothetical protein
MPLLLRASVALLAISLSILAIAVSFRIAANG